MNLKESNKQIDSNETIFLVVRFKIAGTLRFLSHSQMLSVFQRAFIRANIPTRYSEGFNPRPKISLPLPRPVGVESDDELLVISVNHDSALVCRTDEDSSRSMNNLYSMQYLQNLSAQLPSGCELKSVDIVREKPSFQPCCATYIFTVWPKYMNENLKNRINTILLSESLIAERPIDTKGRPRRGWEDTKSHPGETSAGNMAKKIEVRGFLISIMTEQNCIIVKCKISSAGSIRIQEIMHLLELDTEMLACPIKRTNVQWQGI